jgi:excisionase family DNA binding protein
MNQNLPPKSYSPQQLADLWTCSRKTILRAIRRGDLPSVKIGPQTIRVLAVDASIFYLKNSRGLSPVVPTRASGDLVSGIKTDRIHGNGNTNKEN